MIHANGFSWQQKLVLRAAASVDYLPYRLRTKANLPYGVYASLVDRGYLQPNPCGWELTPEGRALNLWWTDHDKRKMEENLMNSHLPRYYVMQSAGKWLVLDRTKYKLQNDEVASFATRKEARQKAQELNNEERHERAVDRNAHAGETI
jgi:hypothetical protein